MTAPTTGRRSAGAATALITLERRGPVSLRGRGAAAYACSVALDRRLRTTVPDWNDPGRYAARQAGFTPLEIRAYHQQHYQVFEHTA